MSIRISADVSTRYNRKFSSVVIRAIDDTVRYAQGAHVTDGAYWLSSPMGPIEGYPTQVPSANRVHTLNLFGLLTRQANALRALSSPTLSLLSDQEISAGCNVRIQRTDSRGVGYSTVTSLSVKPQTYTFSRGNSIGIASEDSHCLNTVRATLRDNILSDTFIRSYLETALWSSTMMPENDDVSDLSYFSHGCDVNDCSLETIIGAKRDCDGFRESNDVDLDATGDDDGRNGHNFWLSRNGHGAGFFDRCDEVGTRLQDAARAFGEVNLYHVGDVDNDAIVYSDVDVDTINGLDLATIWS